MIRRPPLPPFDHQHVDEICGRLGIRLLVLFGSRATGSPPPGPESDLDLAVSLTERDGPRRWWACHEALSHLFPAETVDLAVLDDADPLFRWEILREAVLLWGDPDAFCELRVFAFKDFVDSADLRALEVTLSERKLMHIKRLLRAAS